MLLPYQPGSWACRDVAEVLDVSGPVLTSRVENELEENHLGPDVSSFMSVSLPIGINVKIHIHRAKMKTLKMSV